MIDGWLNLAKFLSSQLGIPGALCAGLACYLAWLLNREREDHKETRKQIDVINDKRVTLLSEYQKLMYDYKVSIDALTAMVGKAFK